MSLNDKLEASSSVIRRAVVASESYLEMRLTCSEHWSYWNSWRSHYPSRILPWDLNSNSIVQHQSIYSPESVTRKSSHAENFNLIHFNGFQLLTGKKRLLIEQAQQLTLLLHLCCMSHLTDTQLHILVNDCRVSTLVTEITHLYYNKSIIVLLGKHHCCYSSNL